MSKKYAGVCSSVFSGETSVGGRDGALNEVIIEVSDEDGVRLYKTGHEDFV